METLNEAMIILFVPNLFCAYCFYYDATARICLIAIWNNTNLKDNNMGTMLHNLI